MKISIHIAQHFTYLNDSIAEATSRRIRNALHEDYHFITLDNLRKWIGVIGNTGTALWTGWSKTGQKKWPIEGQHSAEEGASQRNGWHGQAVRQSGDEKAWVYSLDKDTGATHWLGTSDLAGRGSDALVKAIASSHVDNTHFQQCPSICPQSALFQPSAAGFNPHLPPPVSNANVLMLIWCWYFYYFYAPHITWYFIRFFGYMRTDNRLLTVVSLVHMYGTCTWTVVITAVVV